MEAIESLIQRIDALPAEDREALEASVRADKLARPWVPNPGPQKQAWDSQADVLLYGGSAGGGKTDLLLGLAFAGNHRRVRLYRRQYVELSGLEERAESILGTRDGYNGQDKRWRLSDRIVELGAMQHPGDEQKFQGRACDLIGFDEAAQFSAYQVRFVMGWMRSAHPGQRCRAVLASNPPLTDEGAWIIDWFAPWIDPDFQGEKAAPGEIRWAVHIGDEIHWVDDGSPVMIDGEERRPRSYSFVPASLSDNPDIGPEYLAQLDAMPEPLRSKLKYGDFLAGGGDDAMQVIPSDWVRIAQDRWDKSGYRGIPATALGVDVAQGGSDRTAMVRRHDWWFSEIESWPGAETPDGPSIASLAATRVRDGCAVHIDTGGGWGNDAYRIIKESGIPVVALSGAERSNRNDKSGKLKYANKRAEWYWDLREALDPEHGDGLALPPGRELLADLCAARYLLRDGGRLLIESKADIRKRLGRSPDLGDAIVYAFAWQPFASSKELASLPTRAVTKLRRF